MLNPLTLTVVEQSPVRKGGTGADALRESIELAVACEEMGYEVWQPKYASQIHCYMAGLGLANCVVVVYNKNTSAIYVEQIRFDVGCYRRALADTELILRDNKGKPPERPVEAKNQSCPLCKWCDFKGWCWGPTSSVVWED